jgi:hypothetical protein
MIWEIEPELDENRLRSLSELGGERPVGGCWPSIVSVGGAPSAALDGEKVGYEVGAGPLTRRTGAPSRGRSDGGGLQAPSSAVLTTNKSFVGDDGWTLTIHNGGITARSRHRR